MVRALLKSPPDRVFLFKIQLRFCLKFKRRHKGAVLLSCSEKDNSKKGMNHNRE